MPKISRGGQRVNRNQPQNQQQQQQQQQQPPQKKRWNNSGPKDIDTAAKGTNPNYRTKYYHHEYDHNCQRCVTAFELRTRGYDVEANAFDYKKDKSGQGIFRSIKGSTPAWMAALGLDTSKAEARGFRNSLINYGPTLKQCVDNTFTQDGMRGILKVHNARHGHVVNIVRENGTIYYVDAQSNIKSTTFKGLKTGYNPNSIDYAVYRTDDKKINFKYASECAHGV